MTETINSTKKYQLALGATLGGLIVIMTGAYLYTKLILGKALTPIDAAKVVPESALMATYIVTEPKAWSKMSKFGTTEAQQIVTKTWQQLNPNLNIIPDFNYDQDVKPWLGNMMFAVLPKSQGQTENNVLIVVGITNKAKALQFGLKVKKELKNLEEKEYKKYPITKGKTAANNQLNLAFVNDYLIIGSEEKIINSAIDSFNNQSSFANSLEKMPLFQRDLGLKNPLAQIYLPNYSVLIEQGLEQIETINNDQQLEEIHQEIFKDLKQIDSAIIGMGIEDDGLHFQAITQLNPDYKFDYLKPSNNQILDQFPQETFLLFTGQGINQIWTDLIKELEDLPEFKSSLDQARKEIKKELNLDLDRDLLSWLNGEIALGLINSNQGAFGMFGVGGAFAVQTSDRPTAENTINTLTNYFKTQLKPFIFPTEKTINELKITEWKTPTQEYMLGYGWNKKDTFLMTFGTPFQDFLNLTKAKTLRSSKNFQSITKSLPTNNLGYLYFDMKQAQNIIQKGEQFSGQKLPNEAQAFIYSIKGIALTSSLPEDLILQSDLILSLEKIKK